MPTTASYKSLGSIRKVLDIKAGEFETGLKARVQAEIGKAPQLVEMSQKDARWEKLTKPIVKKLTSAFAAPPDIEADEYAFILSCLIFVISDNQRRREKYKKRMEQKGRSSMRARALASTPTGSIVGTKALTSIGQKLQARSPTPGPGDTQETGALVPSAPVASSPSLPVQWSPRTTELLARLRRDGVNACLDIEGEEDMEETPDTIPTTGGVEQSNTDEDDTGDEEEDRIMLEEMRRLHSTNGRAQPLWKERKEFDNLTSEKWKHSRR